MKKQTQILLCVLILLSEVVGAQSSFPQHMWIFFRDKGTTTLQSTNPVLLGISERALKRRMKVLPPDHLIDQLDLPVSENTIDQIRQIGVKIRTVSRWFNAVSVETTPSQLQALKALPMVALSEQVKAMKRPRPVPSSSASLTSSLAKKLSNQGLDYGPSATQLTNMKVVDLHAIGVTGTGVLIGILDDGFNNYRTHDALKNIKIVADSDFIHNINDVNRQPWENSIQGNHGAGTLSAVGGFAPGQLIGAAYGASFLLAKTEMDSSGNVYDFNSEEDTYVAALEWAERLGADITSSSLGYKEFWSSPTYTTSDLNGRTTKVAQAAAIASRKGVLVVTAMGNEGDMPKGLHRDSTLLSPADVDSIISVGATASDGELASFSGCGPTADGRIKPEVVAQGMAVYWADGSTTSGYEYANGTSCSTPLVAGAAALVLSTHPGLTPMQVREALIQTAIHINTGTSQTATYPNNYYGYGFVNALAAALFYGHVFSNTPIVRRVVIGVDSFFSITTNIITSSSLVLDSLLFYYRYGQSRPFFRKQLISTGNANEYTVTIPKGTESLVYGYFYAREQSGYINRFPFNAPDSLYSFSINQEPTSYVLHNNYPNPFNSGTTLSFDAPKTEHVELSILNILGQHIETIFSGEAQSGFYRFLWDGTNAKGIHIASGVYIYRLKTSSTVIAKKMLFLK